MNRLELLVSLTKGYSTIADIGTDHAYVVINSVKKHNINKAFACDINELPLKNALKNIKKNNLLDKITILLSDGLEKLTEEVELIIISGMGGLLIRDILSKDILKAKKSQKLILQANSDRLELRKFLSDNCFVITNEHNIVDKGKYYEIIECIPSDKKVIYNQAQLTFGPFLLKEKNEIFKKYYKAFHKKLVESKKKAKTKESLEVINEKIKLLEEVVHD